MIYICRDRFTLPFTNTYGLASEYRQKEKIGFSPIEIIIQRRAFE